MNILSRIIATGVLVCLSLPASACDICGCSGGGNSLGLLPLMPRHFAGFRWQTQAFNSDAHGNEPNSVERFSSLELWGRWNPHRRIQIIGTLPFQFNQRRFDTGKELNLNGFGDATLLAQFSLLDPARQANHKWQQTMLLGGGVKLPTGKTGFRDPDTETGTLPPALQPGSGSLDVLVSGMYALRHNNWGVSLDGAYHFMGSASEGYRFGNRLNSSFRVFVSKKVSKTSFLPYAGASFDHRNTDTENGARVDDTGGWATFGMLGTEVFSGNFAFSLGWQIPLTSDFANGHVKPQSRLSASAVFLFGGGKTNATITPPIIFPNIKN